MVHICRAEDGEVFHTNATIHDIEGSGSLEAFLRKEIGIEEDAALAYLSDGRKLRTDNLLNLAEVHDQTIFVFNKYYLDRDPDEVANLLHMQPPLQPPIEDSQTITPFLKLSDLGAAFHRAAETHVQSISRIVDSMRHQGAALRLASSVVDFHVLNVSDVVTDARQELKKRASLVAGVDGAMELASRVWIHRKFTYPAVQRAMNAGGPAPTLGHYVSGERIGRAVEEFHDLQERLGHIDAMVKQLVEGATDARSTCADASPLDTAVTLELNSQNLRGRVTSALEAPVVNVGPILRELRSLDVSIRANLSSVVELKNAYTSQCLRAFRQIHTLNAGLAALTNDFTGLHASLETKGTFSDIERLHNMVYAYGATMIEVVRRKEFARLCHRKSQGFSEVMSNLSAAETQRRQAFRDEILEQLPFDLIGMDETLPTVGISVSEGECTNSHYTLERRDINDLLRVLNDSQRAPNVNEAVPVKVREVCTNLEGLVGNIDALESGFNDLVERSLLSSSQQAAPGISAERASKQLAGPKAPVGPRYPNEAAFDGSEPEMVYLGEQPQAAVNDHERVELLERELHRVRAQLESETTARHALDKRFGELRSILQQYKQGQTESSGGGKARSGATEGGDTAEASEGQGQDALVLEHAELRAVMEAVEQQLQIVEATTEQANTTDRLIAQSLEVAAAYHRTCTKALTQAYAAVTLPSTVPNNNNNNNNSEAEEVDGPSERQPPPPPPPVAVDVDLSDPVGAIEELRSFDHDGLLEAIAKTGKTIRKWQKMCKAYRERSKGKISFRNFAEGDLALFLPTRNSPSRPWAAFNVSFPHYFLQATGHIAEQLTTRDWIVARITNILERVVEPNNPESNPYGLEDGVKYYMLQVEDWTQLPKQRPSKKTTRPGAVLAAPAATGAEE